MKSSSGSGDHFRIDGNGSSVGDGGDGGFEVEMGVLEGSESGARGLVGRAFVAPPRRTGSGATARRTGGADVVGASTGPGDPDGITYRIQAWLCIP